MAYDELLDSFYAAYVDFLKVQDVLSSLLFTLWILIIFFGFLFIWFKYIQDLSKNIWRIQGMLSMIPTDIVCNNPRMKAQFIEGGLAKGVK